MTPRLLLECRDLTMRFGGLTAIDGLDLGIREGEILGLVGPNGSGKTTFFNVITGFYRASSGALLLDGKDLFRASPQAINLAGIARTFQRSRVNLAMSVFDNVAVGAISKLDLGLFSTLFTRRVWNKEFDALETAITAILHKFSPALADRLFDAAGNLPMIDRRRIEIARALVGRPRLLLLDEPSPGMTHTEMRQLMDDVLSFRSETPGLSIVLVEHAMDVIQRVSDRCVALNFGRKLFEGSFLEMTENSDVRIAYLGKEES